MADPPPNQGVFLEHALMEQVWAHQKTMRSVHAAIPPQVQPPALAKDPICGMVVPTATALSAACKPSWRRKRS
jgi:hypothetical protein